MQALQASEEGAATVTRDDVVMFVRNCLQIEVLSMNTIRAEQEQPDWSADVQDCFWDPDAVCGRWLVAIKAFEKAASKSANPAAFSNDPANEAAELAALEEVEEHVAGGR